MSAKKICYVPNDELQNVATKFTISEQVELLVCTYAHSEKSERSYLQYSSYIHTEHEVDSVFKFHKQLKAKTD